MASLKDFGVTADTIDAVRAAAEPVYLEWQKRAERFGVGPAFRGRVTIYFVKDKAIAWRMVISDRSNLIANYVADLGEGVHLAQHGEFTRALSWMTGNLTTRQYESLRVVEADGEQPLRRRAAVKLEQGSLF